MNSVIIDGEGNAPTFIFAHGAGADMHHSFMELIAKGLVAKGIRVVRFNFPYMQKRAEDGKRRPPDRSPKLLAEFEQVISYVTAQGAGKVVIGGKSMGGRMASHLAEHQKVSAIACLGFPFHPPKKLDKYRGEHLESLPLPTIIFQGERDTFGTIDEVSEYSLSPLIELAWLADGDHSFKPRKRSGFTEEQNMTAVVDQLATFIHTHTV